MHRLQNAIFFVLMVFTDLLPVLSHGDPCADFKCYNGGTCQADLRDQRPYCNCLQGFYGDNCQLLIIDLCRDYCLNQGRCLVYHGHAFCKCPNHYYGERCQMVIDGIDVIVDHPGQCPGILLFRSWDMCSGVHCDNDWECSLQQKCCWTLCGKLCLDTVLKEHQPDPCEDYCLNGGSCTTELGVPTCNCPLGLWGTRCEFIQEYRPGTCPHPSLLSTCMCECETDENCRENLKCCQTACGGRSCSSPVSAVNLTVEDPCDTITCGADSVSRVVVQAPNTEPHVECVPWIKLPKDIDRACIEAKHTKAILTRYPSNDSVFRILKCKGSHKVVECPAGSSCVDDCRGGAICCHGKLDDVVQSPLCPIPTAAGVRKIEICISDEDCGPDFKCCEGPSGNTHCTQLVTCPNSCPNDYTCLMKPAPCPVGTKCQESLNPVCVPNNCTHCRDEQECVNVEKECVTGNSTATKIAECRDVFECREKNRTDECGGCKEDQVCIDTGIACITEPCPTFKCVANNSCGGCRDSEVCVESNTTCETCRSHVCQPRDLCGGCGPAEKCMELFNPCNISEDCQLQIEANASARCELYSCDAHPVRHCDLNTKYYEAVPIDICEMCPPGLVCVDTLIRCVRSPCPTYKCVKPEHATCRLHCDGHARCLFVIPECNSDDRPYLCTKTPVQRCVPEMKDKSELSKPRNV